MSIHTDIYIRIDRCQYLRKDGKSEGKIGKSMAINIHAHLEKEKDMDNDIDVSGSTCISCIDTHITPSL
jgi:hypothetical protein